LADSATDTGCNFDQCRVVLLSGTLRLSGSTTWILALQGALRQLGCPVLHIVVGERSEVAVPADYAIAYTGRARRHPLLRLCRLLQLHKLFPAWFANKSDQLIGRRLADILRRRGWQDRLDLVIKDFTSDTPSYFHDFKLVSVIHQMLSCQWQPPQLQRLTRPGCIFAAVSRAVAADAVRQGLEVSHILYNPLDAVELRKRAAALPVQGEYLVFVGKLDRGKGVYELLEAYAQTGLQLPLWFIGDGRERAGLERRARQLGLQQRIQFAGFQPNPYPFIAQARLLVLPSRTEAMGYVCLEAAVLGTPFVVSDYPAAKEFFESGALVALEPAAGFVERLGRHIRDALAHPGAPALRPGVLQRLEPRAVARSYLALM
jgi:glycosyltransferase involved in cell wall biosynthesis